MSHTPSLSRLLQAPYANRGAIQVPTPISRTSAISGRIYIQVKWFSATRV